ncbi:MAG: 50S ribosomal protein L21 [Actinomycetota bacterium]|jgi:large subunit ribosomal protein L21|nr:50S ribosomal protein L21 [Actinomycetota bacterium]
MYAVITTGGKQEKVSQGQILNVELLGVHEGSDVSFTPILIVEGDSVITEGPELTGASVTGKVVGVAKGPKIVGFKYRSKSRYRRKWGHRQKYSVVEITGINK